MGDKWRRRGKIQKSSNVLECPASGSVLGASTSVGIAELLKVKVRLSAGLRPVLRVRVWVLRTHSCLSIERLLLLSEPWVRDGQELGVSGSGVVKGWCERGKMWASVGRVVGKAVAVGKREPGACPSRSR